MPTVDITDFARGLGVEESIALELEGCPVALCRTEQGLYAVANTCTHAEARLTEGFVMDDSIECPLHQARFSLATGERLEGPDCAALQTYPVRQDGERWLLDL